MVDWVHELWFHPALVWLSQNSPLISAGPRPGRNPISVSCRLFQRLSKDFSDVFKVRNANPEIDCLIMRLRHVQ